MNKKTTYKDNLIEISNSSIVFFNYYYYFGTKMVLFDDIEMIIVNNPTILSGKYRSFGTGDFRTWFPPDNRTKRDKIFIIIQKNKWWRVGFTVEDSQAVLNLLEQQCKIVFED